MPGRFLEIPVFLGDYFIMPHPVAYMAQYRRFDISTIALWQNPLGQ